MASIADALVATVGLSVPGRQVWDGQVVVVPGSETHGIIDRSGYVAVYCPEGDAQLGNLAAMVDGKAVVVRVNSFGPTRKAAGWLSLRVADYLILNGVDVAGWGHGDVSEHYSRPPTSDEDVKEFPLVMIYDEFHLLFARSD